MAMTLVAPLQQLAERTGFELALLERPAVRRYLQTRCQQLGLPDEAAYVRLATGNVEELERLIQEVSVPETWFFRYPASYQLLSDHVASLSRTGVDTLRMLSVACATGEEPYSMAMAAAVSYPLERIVVDGIDRHEGSLATARAARYGRKAFRETMPSWGAGWFAWDGEIARVDSRIQAAVTFSCRDVLQTPMSLERAPYQIIFCRNLFIYLGESARRSVIDLLLTLLAPDGLLFVGHAEVPVLPEGMFESAKVANAFAMRRKQPTAQAHVAPPRKSAGKPEAKQAKPVTTSPVKLTAPPKPTAASADRDATLELARELADTGQLEAAIAVLEALQATQQIDCEALSLLGSIQLSLGRPELARSAFNKVLYLQPNHETALLQMAMICEQAGQAAQGARFRRRAARAHDQESGPVE